MRILILGHGSQPIPPLARGAVETIVWEYATRLRARNHVAEILNVRPSRLTTALPRALKDQGPFDWIWSHHERMVPIANSWGRAFGARVVHTSHRPVTDLEGLDRYTIAMLRRGARAGHHLCLTRELMLLNRVLNPACRVAHHPNGVDVEGFRYSPDRGNGRAILVGGVSKRKRQREVLHALEGTGLEADVVGPLDHDDEVTAEVARSPYYRGEWTRAELADRLTEASVLVLFSRAEAQPLVVGEAFAAGLPVVLSPQAARNVDLSLPFVHVARNVEEIVPAVHRALAQDPAYRSEIRAHAEAQWALDPLVDRLLDQLAAWSAGP